MGQEKVQIRTYCARCDSSDFAYRICRLLTTDGNRSAAVATHVEGIGRSEDGRKRNLKGLFGATRNFFYVTTHCRISQSICFVIVHDTRREKTTAVSRS